MPVYACRAGTVIHAGAASGYGGPDPAGWLVIDHPADAGGGCTEYGHIIREVAKGELVRAGQRIGRINPSSATNGGVSPHLHLSVMPGGYDANAKIDPLPWLGNPIEPDRGARPDTPTKQEAPVPWKGDPTFLEDVLRPVLGNRLRTLPGWRNAGHGDFKDIRGIMWHHTGNARESAESIRRGRPDLAGPLAQIHIGPDGTVTLVAVGVCWHAGVGSMPWLPTNMGNWHMIGIECAWPFDTSLNDRTAYREPWPQAQINSMLDVGAALSRKLLVGPDRNIGHKDYAGRAQGKWDPGGLDTPWLQARLGERIAALNGAAAPTVPILTPPPVPAPTPPVDAYRDILLHRGMGGLAVTRLQTRLQRNYSKLVIDGDFGPRTEECVRDYQRLHPPLAADGVVGPATAAALKLELIGARV